MSVSSKVRLDKFLWAVRLFKTRSLSTSNCQGGKVEVNGRSAKPSYLVKIGDEISISRSGWIKSVKVSSLLDRRVGAPLVAKYLEDLTPENEYKKARAVREERAVSWLKHGARKGRPAKRNRRQLDRWFQMHVSEA
ncbi:MAG: RNA-binding S4 domain-containing protein [Verrucomicrobiota bacterium]